MANFKFHVDMGVVKGPIIIDGNECGRCGKSFSGLCDTCTCDDEPSKAAAPVDDNICGQCGKNFTGASDTCTCNNDQNKASRPIFLSHVELWLNGLLGVVGNESPLVDDNTCGQCGKNFTGASDICTCNDNYSWFVNSSTGTDAAPVDDNTCGQCGKNFTGATNICTCNNN
ncbi:hypothetical protein MMC14_005465 [Varicellaria rhodocarpa]|nr:hypothetical protein [Varicellaria rhodocarpa]